MRILLFLLLTILISLQGQADPPERIPWTKVISEIPTTSMDTLKKSFSKESIVPWIGILGSSALLYHYDEDLLLDIQRRALQNGFAIEDKTKTMISFGDIDILRLPSDKTSALYFLGDGWIHMGIAGGFLAYGYSKDNTRAVNTGLQLVHGMTVSTIFNQILKRSTGRESPNRRTMERGAWRPFPSVKAYNENTAFYDAMPSGHVMTATLVFEILRGNYPEYNHILLPTEIVWVSALSLGMVMNGVHWASDYPLGIAMGYVFAKSALKLGKSKNAEETDKTEKSVETSFYPSFGYEGPMVNARIDF